MLFDASKVYPARVTIFSFCQEIMFCGLSRLFIIFSINARAKIVIYIYWKNQWKHFLNVPQFNGFFKKVFWICFNKSTTMLNIFFLFAKIHILNVSQFFFQMFWWKENRIENVFLDYTF